MREILQPGVYTDFPEADYYRDPCPKPSLTQSVAKILLDRSPLHAWHAHPKLNPDYRHDDDPKFDIGNIAHKLLLGRGKDIVRLEFDDWRTKAAKEARDVASSAGKLGVLGKHYARAERMVAAAREQLNLRGLDVFNGGFSEVALAWEEDGIWCRQLVDWLSHDHMIFADLKTTDYSVAPHALDRLMVSAGWDVQAAFADRGLTMLTGACKRRFLFVAQECDPPYCLSVAEIPPAAMTMGHKKIDMAMSIWADCIKRDRWPGYSTDIVQPSYPAWAENQWLEREIATEGDEARKLDEFSRRKDEGEPLSGHGRAVHNILMGG